MINVLKKIRLLNNGEVGFEVTLSNSNPCHREYEKSYCWVKKIE